MKTRIHYLVALVLALTLVFAMAVTVSATEAEAPAHEDHCVCGGQLEGHEHEVLQWEPWGDEEAEVTTLPSEAGNYYLTADVNLTKAWNVTGKTVNLCLNGHTVNGAGTKGEGADNNPNTIMMGNSADNVAETSISKLVITDCHGGGVIQSDTDMLGGVLRFRNDPYATVEIYGGELKSTVVDGTKEGGAVYMLGGNLYLYGGAITGGDALYASGTTGNKNGGAVCVTNASKFYMYGGTVNGGTDYNRGAGVAVRHADAAFYMYGGTIQGGSSNFGDAIHCHDGIAYVEAGTLDVFSGNNLHKTGNGTITIKTANMPKGINVNTGNIADWLEEGSYVVYNGSYHAGATGALEGDVVIGNHAPHCVCGENLTGVAAKNHTCGEDLTWQPLTADCLSGGTKGNLASGNYFLAGNFTSNGEVQIPDGAKVNICLNGYTWTAKLGPAATFRCIGQLSICDCQGDGTITSSSTKQGGMVFVNPNNNTSGDCTLNIYGGNFVMTDNDAASNAPGGLIQVCLSGTNPAVFNLYGGTLSGGVAPKGGAVALQTGYATMNMYGGKIHNCVSVQGGAIQVTGKLNIYGGEILGATQAVASKGGAIYADGSGRIYQYGGTVTGGVGDLTADNENDVNGGAVCLEGSARYELHDGTIVGGTGYKRGGAVAVRAEKAAFYMYGGTVSGGSANWGNAIHNEKGTVRIEGGIVDTSTSGNSNLHMNSGSLTIKSASFPQGIKLYSNTENYDTLSELLEDGSYIATNEGKYVMGTGNAILVPSTVYVSEHAHCVCNGAAAGHDCQTTGWMAWTSTDSLPSDNGYYYLTEDVTLAEYWEIKDKNIALCLNGHTVTGTAEQTIMVGSTAEEDAELLCKLAVTDCNENPGAIVSASNMMGAVVRTRAYGDITVDLWGGTLDATCEAATSEGGAVSLNNGTFNMYGGTLNGYATNPDGTKAKNGGTLVISGNNSEFNQYGGTVTGGSVTGTDAYGGNIYVDGGALNLYGGSVTGGVAEYGAGNIYVKSGTLTLDGGVITGGTVTGNARMGGNLWVAGGTADLISGTVSGGTAPHGGNLRLTGGTMNLKGVQVTGGTATIHGGNLSMTGGTFNMTDGTVTLGQATNSGGNMYINSTGAKCYLNGGTVSEGTAVGGYGGNIYFNQGGSLGAVTVSGGTAKGFGGSIYVAANEEKPFTVSINGATITNVDTVATAQKGGVIYSVGNLTIEKATISGGNANTSPSGGTIAVAGGTTTITGSTLTAGWGSRGTCVNVCSDGNLTVTDSTFNGRTAPGSGSSSVGTCFWIEGNGTVKLVGNVVITGEGLDIIRDLRTGNTTIDVSELAITGDEKISVRMQTNEEGQVAYAGDNVAALDMVEAFWDSYQNLSYDAESGWIEVVMSALVGYDALGNPHGFATWEAAQAEEMAYFVVYHPVSGTISKDIVLDLNGVVLTDMVIDSGVTVRLVDSQTDDYTGAYGSLSGTVNGEVETFVTYGGKTYVVVCEESAYSAHCYDVKLTHVSLKATKDALGYKAALYGDEVVMKYVTDFGFHMWLDDGPVLTKSKTGTQSLTLRLEGIMENNGGEATINANTFVTLNVDGEEYTKTSGDHATSMKRTILAINDNWTKYTDAQKAAVYGLYENHVAVMDAWFAEDVTNNIKAYEATEA